MTNLVLNPKIKSSYTMEQNIAHKIVFWGTEDFIKKGSLSQVIISGGKNKI